MPVDQKHSNNEHDAAREASAAASMAIAAPKGPEVTSAANQALLGDIARLREQVFPLIVAGSTPTNIVCS